MIDSNWNNNFTKPYLNEDTIHLWLLDISSITLKEHEFNYILSSDELDKKERYYFEKDRLIYGTTRGILRKLLSHYTGFKEIEISFSFNKYGKPNIKNPTNSKVEFNLSHSKNFAIIAFNLNNEIGIDIEYINHKLEIENIVENYFSRNEIDQLLKIKKENQIFSFFNIWTCKEAYIKSVGKGLSVDLKSFDVNVDSENFEITRINGKNDLSYYQLYDIPISDEYKAALLLIGKRKKILKFLINKESLI